MPRVFISYRNEDVGSTTAMLVREALGREFGKRNVFIDKVDLDAGSSWRKQIDAYLERTEAMVVLIGTQWAGTSKQGRANRLWDDQDFMSYEVARALASRRILVIPVLMKGAELPSDMPITLAALSEIQADTLDTFRGFDVDMARLVSRVRAGALRSRRRFGSPAAFALFALLIGVLGLLWWLGRSPTVARDESSTAEPATSSTMSDTIVPCTGPGRAIDRLELIGKWRSEVSLFEQDANGHLSIRFFDGSHKYEGSWGVEDDLLLFDLVLKDGAAMDTQHWSYQICFMSADSMVFRSMSEQKNYQAFHARRVGSQ